ncbi:MAG: ATP-dependent helicase, partial [Thermoplasmatota archaeon]
MPVNEEKRRIIDCPGNVLVTANPGTGKTLLLAHKYVSLLNSGIAPKDILCLTFTRKARCEMQERITGLIMKEGLVVDVSDVNIHTFHSYALENLDEAYLVSTNLLRYAIFRFLKDHKTLSYSDRYLLDTIVPKMENLMRYLKSFGVCVDDIVVDDVKRFITDFKGFSKSELEQFLERFVDIFRYYEQMKGSHGVDYADMLISFLRQPLSHRFSYVLVDELQDVNSMEAEIALRSAEQFIAVGDQKQAIFGFQGGSIINFERFKDSTKFVLSENFRSTNAILSYARSYFSSQTMEPHHTFELEKLENKEKGFGKKPVVYDVEREDIPQLICRLAVSASERSSSVAIIARTNTQIMNISKELMKRNIEHSSTFFAASSEAQSSIITFIRALVHDDLQYVKAAMFTPFFPISIQDAFSLSERKHLTFYDIYERSPGFQKLRQSVLTIEDVYAVFEKRIIPVAISYGEEYLLASIGIMDAFREAMHLLDDKKIENIAAFLESTDLASSESHVEKKIVLTTVHKAKGKQFDEVIYVPVKTSDK